MTDAIEREFASLAERLRDGMTPGEVLVVVSETAAAIVEGADRASVGVLDGNRFTGAAATDEVMRLIDELQDKVGEGPCLESSEDRRVHVDNDITRSCRWPRLAEVVVERTPVRAMLAVPLVDQDRRHGALNVFADTANVFTDRSMTTAAILASFATVGLAAAKESARAAQFEAGMATNREIGTAVGILMSTHDIGQDEAFNLLSHASQRANRKLRDIAAGIVRGESTGSPETAGQ